MTIASLIKAFDALMAFRDAVRRVKGSEPSDTSALSQTSTAGAGFAGQLEARLTSVVVAALKEAFDRDHARLELERAQLEEQRRRAEDAMRLELRRQAADREIGRLRLLAGTALVGWLASVLVLGLRLGDASLAGRLTLGLGWLMLLASLAAAFSAQGRLTTYVTDEHAAFEPGRGASLPLWLLVTGLALSAVSLLVG